MNSLKSKRVNLVYWCSVSILVLLSFGMLALAGKLYVYIDIGSDTYCSYWPYYSYFQNAIKTGSLGWWNHQIGLGGANTSFMSMLIDPFNLLLFLFSAESMPVGLFLTAILKVYVLAYLAKRYFHLLGLRGLPLLVSSLCYAFSGFMVGWGQHYFFATAFVMFTLLLLSFEMLFQGEKHGKLLYILSIAMLCSFSVYFAFMSLLFLILYIIVRYFQKNRFQWKAVLFFAGKMILISCWGILLSCAIFLPQVAELFRAARVGMGLSVSFRAGSRLFYDSVVGRLLSNNALGTNLFNGHVNYYEAPFLYAGILWLVLSPVLLLKPFRKKQSIVVIAGVFLFLAFPFFMPIIFNAFSDQTFRWTFILVPVFCAAAGHALKFVTSNSVEKTAIPIWIGFLGVSLMLVWVWVRQVAVIDTIIRDTLCAVVLSLLGYMTLLFFRQKIPYRVFSVLLLVVVLFDLGVNANISLTRRVTLSANGEGFVVPYFDESLDALWFLREKDKGFYRVSKTYGDADVTAPLIQNYAGEMQYSSVFPASLVQFTRDYSLRRQNSGVIHGLGQNDTLRSVISGKYLLSRAPLKHYGYELIKKTGPIYVYENQMALPFGYLYTEMVPAEKAAGMSVAQRTAALAVGFTSEDKALENLFREATVPEICGPELCRAIPLQEAIGSGLSPEWIVEAYQFSDSYPTYAFILPELNKTPLLLEIPISVPYGVPITGTAYINRIQDEEGYYETLPFEIPADSTTGEVILSSLDIRQVYVEINLDSQFYAPESLSIRSFQTNLLDEHMANLRQAGMTLTRFSGDVVEGDIDATSDGMLFLSIPYHSGFSAYLNGVETPIYQINTYFSGILVEEGSYSLTLRYTPPLFHFGLILSGIALLMMLLYYLVQRKRHEVEHSQR